MKKILILSLSLFLATFLEAQSENKDVTITTTGSGLTLEEAQQSALRSAIEQSYGAFISSKTEIFNDHVVADEMVSVSSGNIKSFVILSKDQLPDGRLVLTIQSVVSIDKLSSFAISKGVQIEVKGGLFAMNIKQQLLNEQSEIKAVAEMVGLLHEPLQVSFDYKIQMGQPKSIDAESSNWYIPLEVTALCNKNIDIVANYLKKTLNSLSLKPIDVENYISLNKQVFQIQFHYLDSQETFYLRRMESVYFLRSLLSSWENYVRLFTVQNGINDYKFSSGGNISKIDQSEEYSKIMKLSMPTMGMVVGEISWEEKLTLSQVEKITEYSVKAQGVISQFKHGGYLLYENEGKGFVVSIVDFVKIEKNDYLNDYSLEHYFNRSEAQIACENLDINGYSDWYLPSIEELVYIFNDKSMGIFKFHKGYNHISSSEEPIQVYKGRTGYAYDNVNVALDMNSGNRYPREGQGGAVRAVRRFGSWTENTEKKSENENVQTSNNIQIKQFLGFTENIDIRIDDDAKFCMISADFFVELFNSEKISKANFIEGDIFKYGGRKFSSNKFIIKYLTINDYEFEDVVFVITNELKGQLVLNKNIGKKIKKP